MIENSLARLKQYEEIVSSAEVLNKDNVLTQMAKEITDVLKANQMSQREVATLFRITESKMSSIAGILYSIVKLYEPKTTKVTVVTEDSVYNID